ncbi:MAG: hypothetical protein KDH08_19315, partial [Anaerolineae bacterium]|nr:hypothetical protein [Anaerolineae bacterium]
DAHVARLLAKTHPHPQPLSLRERGALGFRPHRPKGEGWGEGEIRALRHQLAILPTFQRVDTCAAEFEAQTPYLYSAYEHADEARPTDRRKILILGSG